MHRFLYKTGISFLLLFKLASCRSQQDEVGIPSGFQAEQILDYVNQPEKILTKEMVAQVADVDTNVMIIVRDDYSRNPAEHKFSYSWDSGKAIKVGDGKYAIKQFYSLGIAHVQRISQKEFELQMGTAAGLQQRVNHLAKDTMYATNIAIAEAEYIKDYATIQQLTEIGNVATAAYWEMPIQVLHVYVEGVAFSVTANVGTDADQNRKYAIAIVREIMNQ